MKLCKSLLAIAIAASSISAFAQSYPNEQVNTFLPQDMERAPSGATGPGVVYTQRTTGRVISVGAPITKAVAIGTFCPNQPYRQYDGRVQHPQGETLGSVLATAGGALLGGVVGNQFGGGNGKTALTAIGAGAGATIAREHYQDAQRQPQQGQDCQIQYEQRIVGYSFIAQYESIQMQGFMRQRPQIGQTVEVIIRSTFYAAQ